MKKLTKMILLISMSMVLMLTASCGIARSVVEKVMDEQESKPDLDVSVADPDDYKPDASSDSNSGAHDVDTDYEEVMQSIMDEQGIEVDEDGRIITQFDKDKEEYGLNDSAYRNIPPEGLTEDWETFDFSFGSVVLNYMGLKMSDVEPDFIRTYADDETEIRPGNTLDIGLKHPEDAGEDSHYWLLLTVMNLTEETIPAEDGIVVAVAQTDIAVYMTESQEYQAPREGFILPGGLAPYDPIEKMVEIYGEPDETVQNSSFGTSYVYHNEDKTKSLIINEDISGISSFIQREHRTPDYVEANLQKEGIEDFSETVNTDSFVNINGYKVKLFTTFKDAYEGMNLQQMIITDEDEIIDPYTRELGGKTEMTFRGEIPGYDRYMIRFRLVNMTDEPIMLSESKIIGVNATMVSYVEDDPALIAEMPEPAFNRYESRAMYDLPVTGPFGVSFRDSMEEGFAKIPDDAQEKEFADDGGAFARFDNGNMHYKVFTYPYTDGATDDNRSIEDILLTVYEIVEP